MTLLWRLAVVAAATHSHFAQAQTVAADNDTLPTSVFRTRPQSNAPLLNVTQTGAFSPGFIFLGPYQHPGAGPYIFDKFGNLVWDGFGIVGSANTHDFKVCQYQGIPHLCASQVNQAHGYGVGQGIIIDSNYRVVATVQTGRDAMPADMHEFQLLDGEQPTALLTSYRIIPYDLSKFNITTGQGWLSEGMFQEVDVKTGNVLFEWYSSQHVDPVSSQVMPNSTDTSGDGLSTATAWDYFHINSIEKSSTSGNYLVSARHASAIYYINATDQSIIWQLSYKGESDFRCTNFNFSFQHDARLLSENDTTTQISIFDNGNDCTESTSPESSGRFITIDHVAGTATETRRTLPPGGISSCSQGNTQSLANGHVFQGWGDKAWISEVDGNDDIVLAATFTPPSFTLSTVMNYRAYSCDWESTPSNTIPSVYSYALGTNTPTDLYVSWNGATTVITWRFYGCQQIGDAFEGIGNATHVGFETQFTAPQFFPWVMVEAVALDGKSLANSSFQPTFVPSSTLAQHCDLVACPAATVYSAM